MSRTVYLIAGPSGSGKTCLTQALVQRMKGLTKGITVTTRAPRFGEVNGQDYHFVSLAEYTKMAESGLFLDKEHAYNESYGLPYAALEQSDDVALILTVAGALWLKTIVPNSVSIFIVPVSAEVAAERVSKRNSPNEALRIANYDAEVALAHHFDCVLQNVLFDQTLLELEEIVHARKTASASISRPLEPVHHVY